MISKKDLKDLLALEPESSSPVLSVYLNVDQSRAVNLNRGFEAALKSLLQQAEKGVANEECNESFEEDARGVSTFLSDYETEGKSVVIFCDDSRGYLWHRSLEIEVPNAVHWQERPYIRPLLEARDEYERYGVILTDRARARLFVVSMNAIEELREALAEADVRKFDASGTDQMLSQMSFQRKSDEHARWHLRNVADRMDKLADRYRFDRLILAGTQEGVSELKNMLSERLKKSILGSIALRIDAGVSEILKETLKLQEQCERADEKELVTSLLTGAAKNQLAVTGLEATLQTLGEGRIRQLVYADGYTARGWQCQECAALLGGLLDSCSNCDGTVHEVADLVEALVVRVVGEGGTLEQVRGIGAEELSLQGGGIGAFLRF